MKVDILAFGAHPDDVELSCSGTLLKHIAMGKTAAVIDLTAGELGTRGTAQTRQEETKNASAILGLSARVNLHMPDGFFDFSRENMLAVVQAIRTYQPQVVLANALSDRHPDHGRAAKLVADACFYSGLLKIETQASGVVQKPWRPDAVYHYIQDRHHRSDFVIDITDFMEKKMEAVMAFKTQFYNPQSKEPQTLISNKEFLDFLYARAAEMGRPVNVKYAEGFVAARTPAIHSLFDLY
jgi:bacillithiol biosynthesis deacetylase BshB1